MALYMPSTLLFLQSAIIDITASAVIIFIQPCRLGIEACLRDFLAILQSLTGWNTTGKEKINETRK
jgi:hypothetical protein